MCLKDLLAAAALFDSPGQLGIWSMQSKCPAGLEHAQPPGGWELSLSLVPAEPESCRPRVAPVDCGAEGIPDLAGHRGSCLGPLSGEHEPENP